MSPARSAWVAALSLGVLSALPAAAQTQATADPAMAETPAPAPAGWGEQIGRLEVGYRGVFVNSPGFDPFSTDGYLPAFSMVASKTVFASGQFSFAPGIAWDYGGSDATARGDSTSMHVQRLTVPLEARVHFGRWGYAFGRLAPGAAMERAEVSDSSAPSALTKSLWLFTGDAGAGYALPLLRFGSERRGRIVRAWLQGDVGYTWTPDNRLTLASTGPLASDGVDLGALGVRGAFLRFAVAVSY